MENLRADDGQDESTPRQVARVIAACCLASNSARVCAVRKTPRVVAVPGASEAAIWACQDRDGDECTDKEQVEKYPDPPQCSTSGVGGFLDAGQQHSDQGI